MSRISGCIPSISYRIYLPAFFSLNNKPVVYQEPEPLQVYQNDILVFNALDHSGNFRRHLGTDYVPKRLKKTLAEYLL